MIWSREPLKTATAATLAMFALSATALAQANSEPGQLPDREPEGNAIAPYPAVPLSPQGNSSPPAPVVDTKDYSWLLNQVRQKRQQAIANLRAQQQATANDGNVSGDQHRQIHELRRNYEDQDSQLINREERVNQQLDRLERMLKEHDVLNQKPSTPAVPDTDQTPTPTPTEPETGSDVRAGMTTKPIDSQTDPVESDPDPSESDLDQELPSTETTTTPSLLPSQADAIAVTNQAVDPLALANNLYGSGEYSLALRIYSKIDQSEMVPDDKIWIRFQVANCHRRLGSIKKAETGYRIVTSAAGDSWIGLTARWWLDAIARTARLKVRVKNLEASHEQLRKEIDEPVAEL